MIAESQETQTQRALRALGHRRALRSSWSPFRAWLMLVPAALEAVYACPRRASRGCQNARRALTLVSFGAAWVAAKVLVDLTTS